MIKRCVARLATLPLELCRWLRSEKRTKACLICYCLRVFAHRTFAAHAPDARLKDADELLHLTAEQNERLQAVWESLELDSDKALQVDQVLAFSQALIFDPLLVDPFDSALVHFLAVLSIDPLTERLHTATSYSY
ncbi:MAG: hypothetical protein M1819_000593 [Sarea resinae]|nr:MAG: hypothetical protein M1819_000593 [Sarea resinae]